MSPRLGRTRGRLLRLVRRRWPALGAGLLVALPAVWIQAFVVSPPWWAEGASLVLGATGAALIWAGLTGPRGDWQDPVGR